MFTSISKRGRYPPEYWKLSALVVRQQLDFGMDAATSSAKDRLALDPVQLPLTDPDDEREYITAEGFALFNGIRDAAPGWWGRHLMEEPPEDRCSLSSTTWLRQETLALARLHSAQICPGHVDRAVGQNQKEPRME